MGLNDILELDAIVREWNPDQITVDSSSGEFNLNGVETRTGIFDPQSTGMYSIRVNSQRYDIKVVDTPSGLLSENLIAWYRFNQEDTRDYASDDILGSLTFADPNAYDGFNVNGVTFNETGAQDGTASAVFTGTENNADRFQISPKVLYNRPNYSVSLWLKVDSSTQNRIVNFGNKNNNEGGIITGIKSGGRSRLYNDNGNGNWADLNVGSFNTGEWEHLVQTYNGFAIRGYQDGEFLGSLPIGYDSKPSNPGVSVGDRLDSRSEGFVGEINDLRFYNRALTDTEVSAIYDATKT